MRKYFLSLVLCFFVAENAFADTIDRIKASNSFCDCDPRDGVECPSCSGWRPFCPDKNYSFLYNDWCYKKCPSGTYKIEGISECFPKCPDGTNAVNGECRCPDGEFFVFIKKRRRRAEINSVEFKDPGCYPCSAKNAIWNEKEKKCDLCGKNQIVFQENCICKDGYVFDENKDCIPGCKNGFYYKEGKCVDTCGKDYRKENGYCILDCPEKHFYAYGQCYPCSSETDFSSVEESECLKCSNRKYVNGECKLKKFFLF